METDDADIKPEMEPVYEAGGGEAEGFEQAERQLIENAGNAEHSDLLEEGIPEDPESQRETAEYGEADEAEPSDA
jgi:hypothetical protein